MTFPSAFYPDPAAPFVQTVATVVTHAPASSRYFHLKLHAPEIARRAAPGQFVMLACSAESPGEPPSLDPLLPRPLALLDADRNAGTVELLYFVAGRGTAGIKRAAEASVRNPSSASPPPAFRILGPFGHGFEALENVEAHVAVGGGSGVAPLVFFFRRLNSSHPKHLILAARSQDQLARGEFVSIPNTLFHPATDDGSAGIKGNAVDALRSLLDGVLKNKRVAVYAAGPEPMMAAAAKLCEERKLPCRVSLEARMACGVGVCRACVVDGKTAHPKSGLKRRSVCQDGPVFDPCDLQQL